jgi:hypothetical protein
VETYGTARQAMDESIIWHMRFACLITTATDMIRIHNTDCFPWKWWFCECTSVLHYVYLAFFVLILNVNKYLLLCAYQK